MSVAWTKDQQKVIDLRNRNILVSAAAGSGKTAVLVERIIQMITDEQHPVDIDRMLIVTFTNAAASEMRERIGNAIEKKMEINPENGNLQRQLTLVHNAQITTIHSFCLYVIRNHFHAISLDPNFRIGDEGELKLLRMDVLDRLLERYYREKSEDFLDFIESYATGKNDNNVKELLLQMYEFSMSYPWPITWLKGCRNVYEIENMEAFEDHNITKKLLSYLQMCVADLIEKAREALAICEQSDGPYVYGSTLEQDIILLEKIGGCQSFQAYEQELSQIVYGKLSSKKDESISPIKRELVKQMRDEIKKTLTDFKKQFFFQPALKMIEDMQKLAPMVGMLIQLTIDFSKDYQRAKQEKNIVDFNDLEHYTLQILVDEETKKPTEIAKEFGDYFEEILIDEYQDSNFVQETLLTSVSKKSFGLNNIFMVGDVKQSIYRFRLARPELFMDKFHTYTLEDGEKQRIDLHKNFRSRKEVLESINYIFYQLMQDRLGNVSYDEAAALYPGADFLENPIPNANQTKLILVEEKEDLRKEISKQELEAKAVAKEIHSLIDLNTGMDILDEKGGFRKAELKDIVILLRSVSGWADVFVNTLKEEGVQAVATSNTGYFSTLEIQILLNLIHIIDNPIQEIPLAAVLMSPIGGISKEEMGKIKGIMREQSFYQCYKLYACEGEEESIRKKLVSFQNCLQDFREKSKIMPIHALLQYILKETGYGDFVGALPAGQQRSANIEMLIEKAIAFEGTSYKGLFHFIRYMEQLQKYDVDFGEASVTDEKANVVRIMSIHKSKGLEFPIVFACGMGKHFNNQDARSKIVIHPDLGVGVDFVDHRQRTKTPTLLKKVLARETVLENMGEELRVLYVALTRAKEKLILTGCMNKIGEKLLKWSSIKNRVEGPLSFSQLAGASSCLEWIIKAFMRHEDFEEVCSLYDVENQGNPCYYQPTSMIPVHYDNQVVTCEELIEKELIHQVKNQITKEILCTQIPKDIQMEQILEEQLEYQYPYKDEGAIHMKMTVSEIKKRSMKSMEDADSVLTFDEPEIIPFLPRFVQDTTKEVSGAYFGTVFHKVLECIDFQNVQQQDGLSHLVEEMVVRGKITKEMASVVPYGMVERFLGTSLAKRMAVAQAKGQLFKERPFVIGIPANELYENQTTNELVVVQGIIDAYFVEEGQIILVDYKTDRVTEEGTLRKRYEVQLQLYTRALSKALDQPIKESLIYSFSLNKEIKM